MLDIIRSLAVSLAALIAVIFAAGWFNWYYPSDLPLNQRGVSKSDLEFMRSLDFSSPDEDAEKAMSAGDIRLWPIRLDTYLVHDEPSQDHFHYPIGIWCGNPEWPYTVLYNIPQHYAVENLMFLDEKIGLVRIANKYMGAVVDRQYNYDVPLGQSHKGRIEGVSWRPARHPEVERFRDAYIEYAASYNQRILAENSRKISINWGYSYHCSPTTRSTGKDIVGASLVGELGQMRRSLLRREN